MLGILEFLGIVIEVLVIAEIILKWIIFWKFGKR